MREILGIVLTLDPGVVEVAPGREQQPVAKVQWQPLAMVGR